MKTGEKTNGNGMAGHMSGDGVSHMPEQFAGLYQAGYEAAFASGHEAGYRQGLEAGRLEGRVAVHQNENGSNAAAAAPGSNAVGISQSRLFGLPCTKCRRLLYSDEVGCPYCKAPRAALAEPPSATCRGPEEVHKQRPDGGLEQ